MKRATQITLVMAACMLLIVAALLAQETPGDAANSFRILRTEGQKAMTAGPENFTGEVKVTMLHQPVDDTHVLAANVEFAPGARTAWHTHDLGQLLLITEGKGLVQLWGEPIHEVNEGDIVWFPPYVKHWHGAAPDTSMKHFVVVEIADNPGGAGWLEHVSDEQYNGERAEQAQ